MTANAENWTMFKSLHREIDPPVEVVEEAPKQKKKCNLSASRIPTGKERSAKKKDPAREARAGEIQLKEWIKRKADECGLSARAIWNRYYNGEFSLKIRRVSRWLQYVEP